MCLRFCVWPKAWLCDYNRNKTLLSVRFVRPCTKHPSRFESFLLLLWTKNNVWRRDGSKFSVSIYCPPSARPPCSVCALIFLTRLSKSVCVRLCYGWSALWQSRTVSTAVQPKETQEAGTQVSHPHQTAGIIIKLCLPHWHCVCVCACVWCVCPSECMLLIFWIFCMLVFVVPEGYNLFIVNGKISVLCS